MEFSSKIKCNNTSDYIMNNELLSISLLVDERILIETLSRMGIPDIKNKKLYQTCHLFKQFGSLYLAHFKQLFKFATAKNGMPGFGNVSQEDLIRRDAIAIRLKNWNLINILNPEILDKNVNCKIFCVPHSHKNEWTFIQKINVDNLFNLQ